MTDIAIRVENLGKMYRIGRAQSKAGYRTLRESLTEWASAPLRLFNGASRLPEAETIWALKDVSFEVKRGEVVGIIGRNGAGKSTLLKILSRITEPTTGTVDIYGRVGSLLEVGTGFHPELTGRENIYLNGAILGMKKAEIERKFDEIVAFAEIEKFIDTPVKHYSSGMYVRLAFAVAAHLEPEILLVDEVLAVGDAAFQKKCLGKMGDVAKEGRTVVFVSHNMDSVERLCSQTMWLNSGRVERSGETRKVINLYLNSSLPKENITSNWSVRRGSQNISFSHLDICRIDSQLPSREFKTGDAVRFLVQLKSDDDYARVFVGLQLIDSNYDLVFAFHSRERGFRCDIKKGLNQLELAIPFLPLLPGTYYVNLVVLLPNKDLSDEILMADTFVVHPADKYSSGYPFLSAHGKMLIDHEWKFF